MIDGGAFSPDKAVLCLEPGPVGSNPNRVGFTPIISIFSHECMNLSRLLIANRGEIAIRISRGAANLGIATVGVYSEDDASSLHCRMVDHAVSLKGSGASAYLDSQQLIEIAATEGCDAVHPGYGFLARRCEICERLCWRGPPIRGTGGCRLGTLRQQGSSKSPCQTIRRSGTSRDR